MFYPQPNNIQLTVIDHIHIAAILYLANVS